MNKDSQWSLAFRYVVGIVFFIAVVAFVFYAREAMRNLVIAAFVAYLINPAVEYLSKRMIMTRTAAVNFVYFSSLILLVGLPVTLAPIFYDEAQIVIQDLLNLSSQLSSTLSQPVRIFGLVFHLEEWAQSLNQVQGAFLTPLPEQALQLLETTSVGVLWFVIILVSVHIFLSEWPTMRDRLFSLVQEPYRDEVQELYRRVRRIWMAYLRGQIVLMIIVGVVFTITWLIMGIPGALVLGVIAGLFTLVPDVGPFLAVVIAAGVALLEGSTWIPLSNFWVAGILVIVYLVLINLKNFFLRPIIMGRSVHMNEALVLIAILIATILEGVLGALLVVPVLASVIVIAGYIQRRVLGLPPFEGDGSTQFVAPPEKINPPRREWRRKNNRGPLDKVPAIPAETMPDSFESEATLHLEPQPDPNPAQEKIEK